MNKEPSLEVSPQNIQKEMRIACLKGVLVRVAKHLSLLIPLSNTQAEKPQVL